MSEQTQLVIPATLALQGMPTLSEIDNAFEQRKLKALKVFMGIDPILKKDIKDYTPEDDATLHSVIVSCTAFVNESTEARKPYFAYFDSIRSIFTTREKQIKDYKEACEKMRNAYVNLLDEKRKKEEEERLRKLAYEKEVIHAKEKIELQFRSHVNELISSTQATYNTSFNKNVTDYEKHLDSLMNSLKNMMAALKGDGEKFAQPMITQSASKLQPGFTFEADVFARIKHEVWAALKVELEETYVSTLTAFAQDMLNKLPARFAEFQAMEKANREARAELMKQQEARMKEEEARLQKEAEEREAAAKVTAETNKAINTTNTLFESIPDQTTELPSGTQAVIEITPKNHEQLLRVISFYFTQPGGAVDQPIEKLNTKFASLITFAEKKYKESGIMIEGIEYNKSLKTIAKK